MKLNEGTISLKLDMDFLFFGGSGYDQTSKSCFNYGFFATSDCIVVIL